jgi:hypothetical protein
MLPGGIRAEMTIAEAQAEGRSVYLNGAVGWQYALLGGVLVSGGIACTQWLPGAFAVGGWFTGGVLLLFAAWVAVWPKQEAASGGR